MKKVLISLVLVLVCGQAFAQTNRMPKSISAEDRAKIIEFQQRSEKEAMKQPTRELQLQHGASPVNDKEKAYVAKYRLEKQKEELKAKSKAKDDAKKAEHQAKVEAVKASREKTAEKAGAK